MKTVLDRLIGASPYAAGSLVSIVVIRIFTGTEADAAVLESLGSTAFAWGVFALMGVGINPRVRRPALSRPNS
ncbi:hypothetical protein IEU95_10485 [Hoyosella rhizosphaerae]|uniref:Uncharacterized protein n=1 Tax=Hoyosella rhizosphaerae TaxID=1755582 RepID=A0A916TYM2_9ACTN|nr:hypothetical protein [Hoyosella rhizosphaerae]MBN4927261.1 hypothetical protein [Hoyosella rhizosphaerae]GGC52685.1 hypothetical protein GCM10011410_01250 [Hoyosella rhizosphaerae]